MAGHPESVAPEGAVKGIGGRLEQLLDGVHVLLHGVGGELGVSILLISLLHLTDGGQQIHRAQPASGPHAREGHKFSTLPEIMCVVLYVQLSVVYWVFALPYRKMHKKFMFFKGGFETIPLD